MMPLALADMGTENIIRRIGGSPEVRKHLEDLGFVAGGSATVVSSLGGNLIVKVNLRAAAQQPCLRLRRMLKSAKPPRW